MEHVSWPNFVKIEVLLHEIPCIISYAEFSEESISGVFNAKSSSVWPFIFFDVFNSYSQLFNLEIPITPHFSSKIFLIFFKPASLIKEVIVINCNPLPKTLISVSDKTLLLRSGFPTGFKNIRWGEMTERI